MVEVVVVDGECAVATLAHSSGHVGGVHRDGESDDVDARSHHLAHRRVAQVVEGGEDEAFLVLPRTDPLAAAPGTRSWRAVLR